MLFFYTYVSHQMEMMQEFIDFIFFEVWCKAPGKGRFRFELFNGNPDLKWLMKSLYYGDTQSGDFFYGHVESIYTLFSALTPAQVDQFKKWYAANNAIERICANDPEIQLARYTDIAASHPELTKKLAVFFKRLYEWDVAASREKIGRMGEHYQAFMQKNTCGKCPFCGINDIKGVQHTKREAYDHYLPKALYPFNSINLHNLVPTCHECNSTYKLSKDPAHNSTGGRRKAFYPYATNSHNIKITINLDTTDVGNLVPDNIELRFDPAIAHEEIETWKEIYGIEERYKAKCCGELDGKYWFAQVLDEWKEEGRNPSDHLKTLNRMATNHPFADCNFLKEAFLEGCRKAGLFDDVAEGAAP